MTNEQERDILLRQALELLRRLTKAAKLDAEEHDDPEDFLNEAMTIAIDADIFMSSMEDG